MGPLEGIIVLDFSQYLSGPSAALRLADLGARVIKVERPKGGDGSRNMILEGLVADGDSVLFHTINRNKQSFAADLKSEHDIQMIKKLIAKADILLENFRPGVMDKIGLGYDDVKKIAPGIVYGSVTGYGTAGPWKNKPGQDLLLQSMTGMPWLNGDGDQPPMPFALSVVDTYTGTHLAQGVLSCLFRKIKTGVGGRVEVSLFESVLDMQFEVLTTYLNDGHKLPKRCNYNNAHAYLSAPYGIYQTSDGYIALSAGSLELLERLLDLPELGDYLEINDGFEKRDHIKQLIGDKMVTDTTQHWLSILTPEGYWCSDVYTWWDLIESDGFKELDFLMTVQRPGGTPVVTSRCPLTFDGELLKNNAYAPALGNDTETIIQEFCLQD